MGTLPGFVEGFTNVARDEHRHVAFGARFLRDMAQRDPRYVDAIQRTLVEVAPVADGVLRPDVDGAGDDDERRSSASIGRRDARVRDEGARAADEGHRPRRRRMTEIDFDQFLAVDMRVGRVTAVDDFPEARKPAWKLTIDFGPEIGIKRSSAQITNYSREELEGRLVVAVVNFPPRQIGPFMSEVLTLGALGRERPDHPAARPTPTSPSARGSTGDYGSGVGVGVGVGDRIRAAASGLGVGVGRRRPAPGPASAAARGSGLGWRGVGLRRAAAACGSVVAGAVWPGGSAPPPGLGRAGGVGRRRGVALALLAQRGHGGDERRRRLTAGFFGRRRLLRPSALASALRTRRARGGRGLLRASAAAPSATGDRRGAAGAAGAGGARAAATRACRRRRVVDGDVLRPRRRRR